MIIIESQVIIKVEEIYERRNLTLILQNNNSTNYCQVTPKRGVAERTVGRYRMVETTPMLGTRTISHDIVDAKHENCLLLLIVVILIFVCLEVSLVNTNQEI